MARIAGVELPENKRVDFALTKIYGVGWPVASKILDESKVLPSKRVNELSEEELACLGQLVESRPVEGDLRRHLRENIARLSATGSYRGLRHGKGLPVRGQRTRTNARTKRGSRKTIGAFKKEMLSKMSPGAKTEGAAK